MLTRNCRWSKWKIRTSASKWWTKFSAASRQTNQQSRSKFIIVIISSSIIECWIQVLKLYAWESSFQANIERIRKKEIKVLKQSAYLSAGSTFIWTCAPFLARSINISIFLNNSITTSLIVLQVSLMSFMTFVLESPENVLTADIAFVSLTLFNIMRTPMTSIPLLIAQFVQVSFIHYQLFQLINKSKKKTKRDYPLQNLEIVTRCLTTTNRIYWLLFHRTLITD